MEFINESNAKKIRAVEIKLKSKSLNFSTLFISLTSTKNLVPESVLIDLKFIDDSITMIALLIINVITSDNTFRT